MATRTTKHLNGVASPGLKADDLLNLILKERSKDVDAVPPGFLRAEAWAKKWGMERTRTMQLLTYAVEKGHVEKRVFRVMCGIKRCPVTHYRENVKKR